MSCIIIIYVSPHCKKGEMEEKSVVADIDSKSDTDSKTELMCNLCFHRLVQIDNSESLNLQEKVDIEKT
jgi:hypothetical protein